LQIQWTRDVETAPAFHPALVATPLTHYRTDLQHTYELQPATINRHLISLKRYFAWATAQGLIPVDPARPVKRLPEMATPPRHLTDQEEHALMAAVTAYGPLRDRTMLTVLLHTGIRAAELCLLPHTAVMLEQRQGTLRVFGKRRKTRDVPLNATVRALLAAYLPTLSPAASVLFPSGKSGHTLTVRALGYVVVKYARLAGVPDLSPHDLRHRFGYRMARHVPLHRLADIMGHDSLDTTRIYVQPTRVDLQQDVETIAWE
jgi:integrase/recombinase XerC